MPDLKLIWRCLFSPSLYSIHRGNQHWGKYDPNDWERWGDTLVTTMFFFWNVGVYSSPVLMYLMVRRGYLTVGGAISLMKISFGLTVLVGASYCIRSYGRSCNDKYKTFLSTLDKVNSGVNSDTKKLLKTYDFEFSAWPVEYQYNESDTRKNSRYAGAKRTWGKLMQSPCSIVSYLVLHTVGIRLIYPGSMRIFSYMMSQALNQGRTKLVEEDKGQRFKLMTSDGNYIDTMFIDNRNRSLNGGTLVICSEGNAGYYEFGIMVTPIEANYSVLGWNHPGFAGSSGLPYPEQEQNAMDTVMQFAINMLEFQPQQIVLFGWSIGGYTTSWAAMTYPEVKAVVLDATFDDLLPLAIPRMPAILEPLVTTTIRQQANLDIARQIIHYPGPILVVRRSEDEIICLEPYNIATNRGNDLLMKLLRHRFPHVWTNASESALVDWLNATGPQQESVYSAYVKDDLAEGICQSVLEVSSRDQLASYPSDIGRNLEPEKKTEMLLYLASKYMVDYKSTHCAPLPSSVFRIPQSPY